jgi:nucleotide-binding universal stress UspA family protein
MNMKWILVGVDESAPAEHAARFAAGLAASAGAGVRLVYVSVPNLLPEHPYAKLVKEMAEEEARYVQGFLGRVAAAITGCPVETRHATGPPAESFSDLADAPDVWFAAVGSRGRNAVSRVLLGSFADRVVHVCRKPVLVVR